MSEEYAATKKLVDELKALCDHGWHRSTASIIMTFIREKKEKDDMDSINFLFLESLKVGLSSYELVSLLISTMQIRKDVLFARPAVLARAEVLLTAEEGPDQAWFTLRYL